MDDRDLKMLLFRIGQELKQCKEHLEDGRPVLAYVVTGRMAGTLSEMHAVLDARNAVG